MIVSGFNGSAWSGIVEALKRCSASMVANVAAADCCANTRRSGKFAQRSHLILQSFNSAFSSQLNCRSFAPALPVNALRAAFALPAVVRGPVA